MIRNIVSFERVLIGSQLLIACDLLTERFFIMHTDYKCDSIRELRDQQVRFAPREKKIEQVDCAETLLREIQIDKTYNIESLAQLINSQNRLPKFIGL